MQPIWSAYRAAAYGSGLLKIIDANTAEWTWDGFLRNQADAAGYTDGGPDVCSLDPEVISNRVQTLPALHL